MNIQNPDSTESLVLNLNMLYAPNFVSSSGFKETGVFVILLSQDGDESD